MSIHAYIVQSPILFLVFNRPETTRRVFQKIRDAKPARLYLAADGPRPQNSGDALLCSEVRTIISEIDWPCKVSTLFGEENKGCKLAVSSAIDWFFDQEEEGIILEDDCLPGASFFYFCDQMLEKYRFSEKIFCITGSNAQQGQVRGNGSYYFSQLSNIWGWASWKRVWNLYDRELSRYDEVHAVRFLHENFQDQLLINQWLDNFRRLKNGELNTWDQQFQFLGFFENGLCVTPNVNLVSNIGFDQNATHTFDLASLNANLPVGELKEIVSPKEMIADKEADYFLFSQEFKLDEKRLKIQKDKLLRRRFKRWLRKLFHIKES